MVAFEIRQGHAHSYIARLLESVEGVSDVRRWRPFRGWGEMRLRFSYRGVECVVWEPFGDNSRYWIGPEEKTDAFDIGEIERAFREHRPAIWRWLLRLSRRDRGGPSLAR